MPLIEAKPGAAGNGQHGPGLGLGQAENFILLEIGDGAGQRLWFGGTMGQIQPTAEQVRIRAQNANESFHRQGLSMRGFQVAKDYRLGGHPLLSSNRLCRAANRAWCQLPWPDPCGLTDRFTRPVIDRVQ